MYIPEIEIVKYVYLSGISERAKTRLQRSSSQSSNDSPKHIPNGETEQSPDTGRREKVNANQSEKDQSRNQRPQREPHSVNVGRSSFFDTLDWSQEEKANAEPVQETKQPTEAEETLLGNTSDDDDGFASLRNSDQGNKEEQNTGNMGQSGNLLLNMKPVHISKSESNMFDEEKKTPKTEVIDFFNMNSDSGVNKSADNVDLLTMEKDPTNIELLSGTAAVQSSADKKDLFSSNNDTFDPFQAFAAKKQEPPPASVSKPKVQNEFNSFDPFSSSSDAKSDSDHFGGLNSQTADGGEDLMGSWDTHVAGFSNSPNLSRNSSSSNIAGSSGIHASNSGTFQMGGADIPRNSSPFQPMGAGTFQMGGANIPKTGSGTFQPMGASSNMPKNNSGTFQPMGQAQGFGMKGQAGGKADPFADFGEGFLVFFTKNKSFGHFSSD